MQGAKDFFDQDVQVRTLREKKSFATQQMK
jgi:hypothetical protein